MKCKKPKKGEKKQKRKKKGRVFKQNSTECITSRENTTICFSMVYSLCEVLMPFQNLSYIFHNYIIIN